MPLKTLKSILQGWVAATAFKHREREVKLMAINEQLSVPSMDSAVYHGLCITFSLTRNNFIQIWLTGLTSVPPASLHPPCSAPAPGWRPAVGSSESLACRRLTQAQLGACDRMTPELAAASRDQPLPACKPACDYGHEAVSLEIPSTCKSGIILKGQFTFLTVDYRGIHGSTLQN